MPGLSLKKITYEFTDDIGNSYQVRWDKRQDGRYDVFVSKNYDHLFSAVWVAGPPAEFLSAEAVQKAIEVEKAINSLT